MTRNEILDEISNMVSFLILVSFLVLFFNPNPNAAEVLQRWIIPWLGLYLGGIAIMVILESWKERNRA